MRPSKLRIIAAVPFAILLLAGRPADAFDIPDGQSCGGLVCDLGLFGHKTVPAVAAPLDRAPPAAGLATSQSVKAAQPAPEVARPVAPRRRVAKAVVQPPGHAALALRPSSVPEHAVVGAAPRQETRAAPAVSAATLQDFAPAGMAMEDAAAARPAPQPREPIVLANPYVTDKPVPLAFESVDPTVGAR